MNRRQFLKVGSILVAAPAIVRIESLMPVRALRNDVVRGELLGYEEGIWTPADTESDAVFYTRIGNFVYLDNTVGIERASYLDGYKETT